jgi:organic radical activating enzyme
MNYNIIKIYHKILPFISGQQVSIHLTYDCNLKCDYCGVKIPSGKQPHSDTSTFEQWIDLINRFPCKIKEFYISGGEPTLHPDFSKLVNYLLSKKYYVTVFTNLMTLHPLLGINTSFRFKILATYHHHSNKIIFMRNYNAVSNYHRIDVNEIGDTKILPYSKLKPFLKEDDFNDKNFRISPDRQIFVGCNDHFVNMSK